MVQPTIISQFTSEETLPFVDSEKSSQVESVLTPTSSVEILPDVTIEELLGFGEFEPRNSSTPLTNQ